METLKEGLLSRGWRWEGGGGGRSEESLFFLEKTVLGIVKRVSKNGYGVWDLGWVTDKNLHQKNMR